MEFEPCILINSMRGSRGGSDGSRPHLENECLGTPPRQTQLSLKYTPGKKNLDPRMNSPIIINFKENYL